MEKKLLKFITDNKLEFTEGVRNQNLTILCGFACYLLGLDSELSLNLAKRYLLNALEIFEAKNPKKVEDTDFIEHEIVRLFNYCWDNSYEDFWITDEAKAQYKF